ncbi:MAG: metal ABC transporter ATP-binding protein [Alphaproteobacteria bacterium]|nr:metal ABC transporter ATP-binding protein [Alphaproteobacteria bacterium]
MSAALRLVDVTVTYDRHPAVHHVSVEIPDGACTAVVGPNGAGKSTLLKAMVGLVREVRGRIEFPHRDRSKIAYLPQQSDVDRSFPISVLDMVMLGGWHAMGAFGAARATDLDGALHAIEAVGLRGFERRPLSTLSSGQFQRALFARMLLQDAEIILLDEPFNAIDARTTADLLALVRRWREDKRTVVCVLHDLEQVRANFPHSVLLARELIAAGPTEQTLTAANLLRARAMAESWDETADVCHPGEAA